MSTTNILDLNNRIDALEKNSGGGGTADSAKRSDIATEFNTTTAYTAGCFVYYEGKLYQFNADHSAGAWDPTDVVEANVTDQIVSNASAIAGLTASDVAYDNTDSGLTATKIQGAIDEVVDALDDYVKFPSGTILTNISSYNTTWTATANCWCTGYIGSTNDHLAIVSIDGTSVVSSGGTTYAANMVFPVNFPVKKGQIISTRDDSNTIYNLNIISM